jgi:peptidoglycan/LPS O-acetylase OafA/YrhL
VAPLKRLYSLDALRGAAALSVVLWHWQHFFAISGNWQPGWDRTSQPFYWALRIFYDGGQFAVDLFFAISGFVFFWLYGEAIKNRAVSAKSFALLRFSRLYPLHFATLLLVALLQLLFFRATGNYFIFTANDWEHFLPSLLMAQQWLPPTIEQSFNGPAWSVSVEVLLYGVFFAVMRAGQTGPRPALGLAAVGIVLYFAFNTMIARGVMGFFAGGAAYYASEWIKSRADAKRLGSTIGALALCAWAVVLVEAYFAPIRTGGDWLFSRTPFAVARFYVGERDNFLLLLFILLVCPLSVMALALHEQLFGAPYRRLAFLGDISYSSYLLHFPMQLGLALAALRFGLTPAFFQNGLALVLFYAALILLAGASYTYFERPLQAFLRNAGRARLFPAQ